MGVGLLTNLTAGRGTPAVFVCTHNKNGRLGPSTGRRPISTSL